MSHAQAAGDPAAMQALFRTVVQSLGSGQRPQAVARQLQRKGMPRGAANQIVAEASAALDAYQKSPEGRMALAKRDRGRMTRGLLLAIGGLVITGITYALASGKGGTYYIFWGAVLFGAIDFFAGFLGWLRHQSEI
jgi:hypothetical protein